MFSGARGQCHSRLRPVQCSFVFQRHRGRRAGHDTAAAPLVRPFLHFGACAQRGLLHRRGWRTLGRSFIFYSVIAGGGFSAFYAFFERFDPLWPGLAQMPLVAAVVGALFVGVGAGLSVRAGGAPGGDDALAMALHKVLHQPIERIYLGSDLVVLALSASYLPLERLACSLLTVLLSGQIIGLIQRIPSPSARKAAALESTNK
ncbi:MAG: YitT family protein [Christensenellales bacterium]